VLREKVCARKETHTAKAIHCYNKLAVRAEVFRTKDHVSAEPRPTWVARGSLEVHGLRFGMPPLTELGLSIAESFIHGGSELTEPIQRSAIN
jgi:hypothetical protein